jgi:hypothetical protein
LLLTAAEEAQFVGKVMDKMMDRLEGKALQRFPGNFAAQQAWLEDAINRRASITVRVIREGYFDWSDEERRERVGQLWREFVGEKLLC